MTTDQPGPVVSRVVLGTRLRRLRESRGISAQQAADAIRGSDSKISRIELGRHAPRETDVVDLLAFYQAGASERDELLALTTRAVAVPWWQRQSDALPAWFQAYLGFEQDASAVQSYDTHFVPGLLQTDDYAAGLLALGGFGPDRTARLLAVRSERVARFAAGGWRLTAVIDEAVLRRPVASGRVLASQLRHLAEAAGQPGVTVQIRPLAAGAHLAPTGFTILRFADPDVPDLVYAEQLTGASYLDRPAEVARYSEAFDQLRAGSQTVGETIGILGRLLDELG
jgi:transcriptional regulator with XRE-family HTH domain